MKLRGRVCLLVAGFLLGVVLQVQAQERAIRKEVVVKASLVEVWKAWTTNEGAQDWFAPQTYIDPTVGGHYEIFFFPTEPYGWRGGEGLKVQSVTPMKALAFTWSAPWEFGVLRNLRTIVYLRFEELDPQRIKIHFTQVGWGEGEQWDKLYEYFTEAWDIVLGRLKLRFASGPIDWSNPPKPTESLAVQE